MNEVGMNTAMKIMVETMMADDMPPIASVVA